MEMIKVCGLDPTLLVGQGYDGGANMSGQFKGLGARIRQQYPNAV